MLALSTAWNAYRLESGADIAREILGLDIKAVELNFSLNQKMVDEIGEFVGRNELAVTSLHNFCPTPDGWARFEALPDCYSLSSLDETERQKAVFFTKKTVSTAKKLGARAVVLHSGRVEMPDRTRQLIELSNRGRAGSREYQKVFTEFVEERRLKSPPHTQQIIKSYAELLEYAKETNIVLGVENRFYYREIPSFEEFGILFEHFNDPHLAYWHDVGHAFIWEQLGFMKPLQLLETYAGRLFGMHLHNIRDLMDHNAVTNGDFDLSRLKPYVKQDTIKVMEFHRHVPSQAVRESCAYLGGLFP